MATRQATSDAFVQQGWALARAVCLALAAVVTLPAKAAPAAVEPFDATTFAQWKTSVTRPTWVVFTATWCAVCPTVISEMAQALRRQPSKPSLWVVVVDQEAGEDDLRLLREPHVRAADRVLAFSGTPQAIRHAVEPQWRGEVPYVALMDKGAKVRWFMGKPDEWTLKGRTATPGKPI